MRRAVTIDLNCDLGEGAGHDAELLKLVTTASICCGAHAGNEQESLATLRAAVAAGVVVGAHPGYPDREHFGRREMQFTPDEVRDLSGRQVAWLNELACAAGCRLKHFKAHGALYNQACRDAKLAEALVDVAESFQLIMVALPDSEIEAVCIDRVPFVKEGFADRRYRDDGTLVPRSADNALIVDPDEAVAQAILLIRDHHVQSLCVHGDNPQAIAFTTHLKNGLIASGFQVQSFA